MQQTGERKAVQGTPVSLWTGRILSALPVLFLLFDGALKLVKPAPVVESFAQLGFPDTMAVGIGLLLLVCTVVYVIPYTAVLGAILLTGYLGGATAVQVRVEAPPFNVVFPSILGILLWGGLYLRDNRVRAILPLRLGR